MPVTFQPRRRADSVTARMTAFRPGASPPPVLTRTCILQDHIVATRRAQERRLETIAVRLEKCEPRRGLSRPASVRFGRFALAGAQMMQLGGKLGRSRHRRRARSLQVLAGALMDAELAELPVEQRLLVAAQDDLGPLVERVFAAFAAHDRDRV